jgi:hypothetical protein
MVLVDHFVTRRDGCDGAWIAEQAMRVAPFAMDDQHSYGLLTAATCRAALAPVIAHQMGVIAHLPDPPGALFDSDRITTSKASLHWALRTASLDMPVSIRRHEVALSTDRGYGCNGCLVGRIASAR